MTQPEGHLFYGDLAVWWPLVSAPAEYAEEAAFAASLLDSAEGPTRTVLELGSGGGNNAFHLKARYAMTLVDISEKMLAVSRELNPECEHLQGDMRDLRLGRTFDAVFVHDAIEYMTTEQDLRKAVATAFAHCRPGGVAVLVPDNIADNFEPETEHGGNDAPDGRAVRFLSWSVDPDPSDTTTRTDYAFLIRSADGTVSVDVTCTRTTRSRSSSAGSSPRTASGCTQTTLGSAPASVGSRSIRSATAWPRPTSTPSGTSSGR